MEIHAQVTSNAKLFSGASTEFGGEPNAHVSLVDAAMPGMLPVINEECVAAGDPHRARPEGADQSALRVRPQELFLSGPAAGLPDQPVQDRRSSARARSRSTCRTARAITVGIERLHLEQDAGKSLHDQHPTMTLRRSQPLRRGADGDRLQAGPALVRGGASAYVTKLRTILRYLGTCDGDMEKGSLRADVNVSVRRPGEPLGTRCEIKNVNSIRFIGQAIEYEARRQIGILEDGGTIEQETRLFDPGKGETRSMRSKEEAHDYRYFPDPDLLPLEFDQAYVDALKAKLPELPDAKKARFMATTACRWMTPACWWPSARAPTSSRRCSPHSGTSRATASSRPTGSSTSCSAVSTRKAATSPPRRSRPAQLGDHRRTDRRGNHLRQDRQGSVRDRLARGRRSARAGRDARHEAGHRSPARSRRWSTTSSKPIPTRSRRRRPSRR